MRRVVTGALACALALGACTKVSQQSTGGAAATSAPAVRSAHPGELRIAIQRSPNTLNPLLSANTTEGLLNRLSFSLLVTIASDGKTQVPDLASVVPTTKNGGISADGLTITYHLRHGVVWQDGAPFTSRDVAFSWRAMMNDANNVNERVGYDDVARVDTPDDDTVVFHLKRPFAPFVNTVFGESDSPVAIVPAHLLEKYHDLNRIPFNTMPVGTGPFRVTEWVRGDHITLVANPKYFHGTPKLRRILVREIPDENTTVNALRAGDIDWMFQASPDLANVLKGIPNVKVVMTDLMQSLEILMNVTHTPLDDVRVRRAIAYAVDKQALIDKFTGGTAVIAWADQPPWSWAATADVTKYPADVTRAKALLREAGFTIGADGIARRGGKPLTLQLSYNTENATRRIVAVQVQAMLKAIGIDAQIKPYPANMLFATYGQGGILTNGKFDLNVSGWVAGIDPDDHSEFACGEIPRPGHPDGVNYSRYCAPEMEKAQAQALASYDDAQRKPAYVRIQQLLSRDLPYDYLWFPRQLEPMTPAFKGFAPNPVNEAWNAWQWEI